MMKKTLMGLLAAALCGGVAQAEPLKIGYSDWPGWVAWEVAIQKGWFKEAGVDVQFEWFEYVPSMEAFAAGKLDAVCMTNGDALVTGATGAPSKTILINDFSNGNDMIVGQPGIEKLQDLKGKKVGVEVGFVDHLLLLKGLQAVGMKESDVELVNVPTGETPKALASGDVAAIGAWQPNSGQALKAVPGSKPIYTSKDVPGLIYDVLAVSPASLSAHPEEWKKIAQVWYKVVDYFYDPATHDDAVKIMASRVNLSPEEYAKFVSGTKILKLDEAKKVFKKGEGLDSVYGSNVVVDEFNVSNKVYDKPQPTADYIAPAITDSL
ncbi:NitT/TauT family transport system substrate-binding protein [Terrimicrobium sacchariphilum]|uniref:NitT/TauT family transport system substrate-binding protein n=1 Tax=Terrimicrobium sacchariphilum TaxID=690879 RepID=A0A146GAP3_TERSA|nr:ABC transporter substrate-binding protein [Terrimicrobium sacchariphilum]GAT33646.1 NitT/TauT family transport system substrate-binding protein [Terrimicrobium sacchariphilum]